MEKAVLCEASFYPFLFRLQRYRIPGYGGKGDTHKSPSLRPFLDHPIEEFDKIFFFTHTDAKIAVFKHFQDNFRGKIATLCHNLKFTISFFSKFPPSCFLKLSPSLKPYFYPPTLSRFLFPPSYDLFVAHIWVQSTDIPTALHCSRNKTYFRLSAEAIDTIEDR